MANISDLSTNDTNVTAVPADGSALAESTPERPEKWPAGKPFEHTCESATLCFQMEVDKCRHRDNRQVNDDIKLGSAVRASLQFGEQLYAQIKDRGQRADFRSFLTAQAAAHPRPIREPKAPKVEAAPELRGPLGPVYITVAKVAEMLGACVQQVQEGTMTLAQLELKASDFIANRRRWDPVNPAAIRDEILQQLSSCKRLSLISKQGLDVNEALEKGQQYAQDFLAARENGGHSAAGAGVRAVRRGPPAGAAARSNNGFRGGNNRRSDAGSEVRRDNAPKAASKVSEAETLVRKAKAQLERFDEKKEALNAKHQNRAPVTKEQLEADLAAAKELLRTEQRANADKKKADRIKKAQARGDVNAGKKTTAA